MDYWQKINKSLIEDFLWNIPEQKTGKFQIIGGNINNFSNEIKTAEYLSKFNLQEVRLLLPDALKSKLPPISNIFFSPSTESGSFAKSSVIQAMVDSSDLTLFSGDFSKNSTTTIAILDTLRTTTTPSILTRDTIDLIINDPTKIITKDNLLFFATMPQLQKLFRSLLYPKMIILSNPIISTIETLHKFTLSYPLTILTFHQEQIIIVKHGKVITISINDTSYTPIQLFIGDLAAKISALSLWNPNQPFETISTALFWQVK